MTKDELLTVGMRLMGLYWLVQGITALAYIYWLTRLMGREDFDGFTPDSSLRALLLVFIGIGVFVYSPEFVEWLSRRERARKAGQEDDEAHTESGDR